VQRYVQRALTIALPMLGAWGCNNFLAGGELSNNPNLAGGATAAQLEVPSQVELWATMSSDPARLTSMWVQSLAGINQQYVPVYNYSVSEQTTNGIYTALYVGGGLIDLRNIQKLSTAVHDSVFLGVAEVEEALLMGTAADLFGDVVYSQAYQNPTPKLDPQDQVYAALQVLLDKAIVNLQATGVTNAGPGASDLVYGGNAANWIALAHSVKARLFLHTGKVNAGAYASALTEATLGIASPAGDYVTIWSGSAQQQNFWYEFLGPAGRGGYLGVGVYLPPLLQSTNDPRLNAYYNAGGSYAPLSNALASPTYPQPLVTNSETLLIIAEAQARAGQSAAALAALQAEQANETARCSSLTATTCVLPAITATSGPALLRAILTEKYIYEFQNIEAWNDYKRNCFPNLTPVAAGKIPARLFYDTGERQTDPNIPAPGALPFRTRVDPAAATDPFGNACLGQ